METVQYSSIPWNVQQPDEERPAYKYTRQAADKHHYGPVRTKRATKPKEERNTCSLFIQTDPLLWRHIKEQVQYFKQYFCFKFWSEFCINIYLNITGW